MSVFPHFRTCRCTGVHRDVRFGYFSDISLHRPENPRSEPVEGSSQIEGTGGHSREACRADFRCLPQSQTEAGNRQTRCKALGTALPLPRFENASGEKQYYPDQSRARLGHFRQESSQPENDTCPRRSSRAPVQSRLGQNQPGTSQPGRRRLDGAQTGGH
jgi:hypothetical protein